MCCRGVEEIMVLFYVFCMVYSVVHYKIQTSESLCTSGSRTVVVTMFILTSCLAVKGEPSI